MLIIEAVNENDLKELSLLMEELSGCKTNYDYMVATYHKMKSNTDYFLIGAKYNNELVGTVMGIICMDLVSECKPFMVIENVVVKSTMRGKGIGKELLNEIERIGKMKDCSYAMLLSSDFRKDAHKFYESMGYALDKVKGFRKHL